jgi:hypothetical protein
MRDDRIVSVLVVTAALAVAAVSARAYVGGWNDGSRLATVECLVDFHTLAIDRSVFQPATFDKLLVGGHFYSDKSPVPAVLLAGVYQLWRWCGGPPAATHPAAFCYLMTLAGAGLAYAAAVGWVHRLGRVMALPPATGMLLTGSFALATVALPYVRHVNNHVLLLAVAAGVFLGLAPISAGNRPTWQRLLILGTLAGLGYTIDLGAGPPLLAVVAALIAYRCRRVGAVAVFAVAALPWFLLHHALNYSVGGTFGPANAVPEYVLWPGSPFTPETMTGGWKHTPEHLLTYAAEMLLGRRGFLVHDLPLLLAVPGFAVLVWRRVREVPELLAGAAWAAGTWLAYAVNSVNFSGPGCSIRWLVPLLAPGFFTLAVTLRHFPGWRRDLIVLGGWGVVLGAAMWWNGPWERLTAAILWPVLAAAGASWLLLRGWAWHAARRARAGNSGPLVRAA